MTPLTFTTDRLQIRPFLPDDLPTIHRILDQAFGAGDQAADPDALAERKSWLEWSMLNEIWLARLRQPPYGDRAVTLRATGALIGAVGYVPLLDRFEQIPALATSPPDRGYVTPEVGLFWVIDAGRRRQGYAAEAAQALIGYAFATLRLRRILAKTEYDNVASQGVMRTLGMTITRNPLPEPAWLQVVGVKEN